MESWPLSLILAAVACFCCLVLCVFLICLCIKVKRIRRNLDYIDKRRDLEDPRDCKPHEDEGNGTNSNNSRYIRDPMNRKPRPQNSSIYSDPDEQVEYLNREVRTESGTDDSVISHLSPSQNLSGAETKASQEHIPLQFVNQGFHPETSRDSMVRNQSEASDESQPVYENAVASENEQAIYENNNEPIYQNTGELASLNNPDLERCHTMAISDIDKCP